MKYGGVRKWKFGYTAVWGASEVDEMQGIEGEAEKSLQA